jgi:hypothetical protein
MWSLTNRNSKTKKYVETITKKSMEGMLGKGFRNTGTCDFLTVFVFAPPPLLLWLVGEINKTGGG